MYEAIGQATKTTIDPTLKDEKIETVMGKLECKFVTRVLRMTSKQTQVSLFHFH